MLVISSYRSGAIGWAFRGLVAMAVLLAAVAASGPVQPTAAQEAVGGNRLYIYNSSSFAGAAFSGTPQVIDLEAAAKNVGAGVGVRPHLLLFNNSHSHALLANVASGHVMFIDAATRKVVGNIDIGEQAHGAISSPDDRFAIAANQNGKKLARIATDYENNVFTHAPANDLDLKALEDAGHPDNAPICPILFAQSGFNVYVTLRGGGLFVVDTAATPMKVVKSFTKDEVAPAGCGGAVLGTKMYINSGTATSADLYLFDTQTDTLVQKVPLQSPGTDAHGMALVNRRYLWMGYRGEGDKVAIIDTSTNTQVGTVSDVGQAPDLMDVSPAGDLVFVALRGPNNLTGGPSAKGATPGLAVLEVKQGGRDGGRKMFVPIGSQAADSTVDPHAVAVRPGAGPGSPYEVWVIDQSNRATPVAPAPPATGTGQANAQNGSALTVLLAALALLAAAGAWRWRIALRNLRS